MGTAFRVLVTVMLLFAVGLTACGRRSSLDRPPPSGPQAKADPSTEMQEAPDRPLIIDRLLQ